MRQCQPRKRRKYFAQVPLIGKQITQRWPVSDLMASFLNELRRNSSQVFDNTDCCMNKAAKMGRIRRDFDVSLPQNMTHQYGGWWLKPSLAVSLHEQETWMTPAQHITSPAGSSKWFKNVDAK